MMDVWVATGTKRKSAFGYRKCGVRTFKAGGMAEHPLRWELTGFLEYLQLYISVIATLASSNPCFTCGPLVGGRCEDGG